MDDDNQKKEDLVQGEVSAPISNSQVQPGREVVEGNGQRDTEKVPDVRPDTITNPDADTPRKQEEIERQHAQAVQDAQNGKLNSNTDKSQ